MLKIGVVGTGHLGKIHLKCLGQLPDLYEIVGFYDSSAEVRVEIDEKFNVKPYDSIEALIADCEVLDLVTPTDTHFAIGEQILKAKRHLFIEKPVCSNLREAQALRDLTMDGELKVQVGHVERFNPAFQAILEHTSEPMFIEGHRLAEFNPRGTEVSVILDLMIHDLDLLCQLIPYEVSSVQAHGVAVISDSPDICNARIEFVNGAVANLTASRISLKQMRKLRLFQKDGYLSLDFLSKESTVVKLHHNQPSENVQSVEISLKGKSRWIEFVSVEHKPNNAIMEELRVFHDAIVGDFKPEVDIDDAIRALDLAEKIVQAVDENAQKVPG